MIFDRSGRPLWMGRNQRLANAPQRLAVAARDGSCFECGAPMHRCDLHHIQEWHKDGGPTDIDNLVAVCRRHHKWLETENLSVRRNPTGYQTHPRDRPQREKPTHYGPRITIRIFLARVLARTRQVSDYVRPA